MSSHQPLDIRHSSKRRKNLSRPRTPECCAIITSATILGGYMIRMKAGFVYPIGQNTDAA